MLDFNLILNDAYILPFDSTVYYPMNKSSTSIEASSKTRAKQILMQHNSDSNIYNKHE